LEGEVNCDQSVSLKVILPGKKVLQNELYLLCRHPLKEALLKTFDLIIAFFILKRLQNEQFWQRESQNFSFYNRLSI